MSTLRPSLLRFALVWTLQFFGTLLLLAAFCWWLTWPDEHFWQLCLTFVWALLLLAGVACLVRTVFATPWKDGVRLAAPAPAPGPCAATALWIALLAVLEFLLASLADFAEVIAVRLAQVLHAPPQASIATVQVIIFVCAWLVAPALLLPLGSQVARQGWSGWRSLGFLQALRSTRYWGGLIGALVMLYLAYRLTRWVPQQTSLRGEMLSATWRLALAYILGVTSMAIAAWSAGCALAKPEPSAPSVES